MTVQASTNRGSTRRPKASVRRGIKRQSTQKGNLSGTCKRKRQKNKRKGGNQMEDKKFLTVDEVAKEMSISKSYAYKIVKELNKEMNQMGYVTVAGRVNANYFNKKVCYNEANV
jgi:hypothetical protein